MARVVIENLTKIFTGPKRESIRAVSNASLVVEDGEFLVLVGPSGCGKSTTLRLIAGLDEITQGTISIDGQVVNGIAPKDRDIAMVFQHYALYPHMTAYENMAFGLRLRKYPAAEINERVRNAAAMLGLEDCLDRKPKALSGGQRQRVAVGRAIVRKPKVFLFDEPLSNLDARLRAQMRLEISRLHARLASTMIYVTHDQVEAMTMGDRIAVMKEGVIQQVDEPMNLYHRPASMFVAGFIGSPSMNFFQGGIVRNGTGAFFQEQGATGDRNGSDFMVRLEDEMASRLADYAGKKIVLGLRPENIAAVPHPGDTPPERTVAAVVELIEPMGPETYLHAASGSHSFTTRIHSGRRVEVHQKMSLVFDMASAHFFDPGTEKAII